MQLLTCIKMTACYYLADSRKAKECVSECNPIDGRTDVSQLMQVQLHYSAWMTAALHISAHPHYVFAVFVCVCVCVVFPNWFWLSEFKWIFKILRNKSNIMTKVVHFSVVMAFMDIILQNQNHNEWLWKLHRQPLISYKCSSTFF